MSDKKLFFGWRRDLPDQRDVVYSAPLLILKDLPQRVDLRPDCTPILDQGNLGSCTANAIASAHEFAQRKQGEKEFAPSRLFIYYNERKIEGTEDYDSGAYIRDGFKTIAKQGVCPESIWEYNIQRFKVQPNANCYAEAENHQAIGYQRINQVLSQMKGCLADGFPFVFGFSVYESFRNAAKDGNVPLPSQSESFLGGHAVLCVGYNDASQQFIIQNSWGESWGDKGFGSMPYSYLTSTNLAGDFWTCSLVE